ncbi:MAG: HEPN domain-containing protein [Synechococcaceae cyanobacterium]
MVFHAQQCVEKLPKARLIQLGQPVDKIHDMAALSPAAGSRGWALELECRGSHGSLLGGGACSLPRL